MVDAHAVLCYNDILNIAGWSSLVARWAHNPKVAGSNPAPATNKIKDLRSSVSPFFVEKSRDVPLFVVTHAKHVLYGAENLP